MTDLLFLCPLPEEADAIRRVLEHPRSERLSGSVRAWTGRLAGRTATVWHTGDGPARARAAAPLARRARRTVIAGVAGALREDLRVGDLVVADAVYDEATGARTGAHAGASGSEEVARFIRKGRPTRGDADPSLVVAPVLTAIGIAATPAHRERLASAWSPAPAAADLETWSLLEALREDGGQWAVLRAISDRMTEELPPFLESCRDRGGAIRRSAVARAALAHAGSFPTLLRLRRNVSVATRTLAAAAVALAGSGWCEGGDGRPPSPERPPTSHADGVEESLDAADAVP